MAPKYKGKKVTATVGKDLNITSLQADCRSQGPEKGSRDKRAQLLAGGSDRLPSDHGGHLIASMFGGSGKLDNLVAMDGNVNQSAFNVTFFIDGAKITTDLINKK